MPTIHDVALRAGLSVTTVSRVLNNRGYISSETRKKVHEVMEELNYQPNELARALLKKQSNLIGLIIPTVSHPFFGSLAAGVEAHAYEHGMKVLLCNSMMDPVKEKEYIEMMKKNRVAGILMGSHTLEIEEYVNLSRPIVSLDRKLGRGIPSISSDNHQGGRLAAQLLIDRGARKLGHVCGNLELDMLSNLRTDGFRETAEAAGVPYAIRQTELNVFDYEQYEPIIHDMFREHPDIDGVFATSDILAAFVVRVAQSLGRRIPEDLMVVGYDDIPSAAWSSPSLTSVRQPLPDMSRLAVELIRRRMNGEAAEEDLIVPVTLIERETTR